MNHTTTDQQQSVNKTQSIRRQPFNKNVKYILILCVVQGLFDSLWQNTILIAYIEKMMGEPKYVGISEAVQGAAMITIGLPIGYISDKKSKSKIIKYGGIFSLLTLLGTVSVLYWIGDDERGQGELTDELNLQFKFLMLIMGCWGVVSGLINGPALALFANSIAPGQRSKYYTYLFVCYVGSLSIGPLINIILFQYWGDNWEMTNLYKVSMASMIMGALVPIPMFLVSDDYMIQEKQSIKQDSKDNQYEKQKNVPYLMFTNAMLVALGSGMSIKFFPLFYKENVGMSPIQVQLLYFLQPLICSSFSITGQKLSKKIGRVQTMICFNTWSGIQLVLFYIYIDTLSQYIVLIFVLQILRASLANSTYPLEESVLMDSLPPNKRGYIINSELVISLNFLQFALQWRNFRSKLSQKIKNKNIYNNLDIKFLYFKANYRFWKSLESVSSFGWSGSAYFGGLISKPGDYSKTFIATGIFQLVGIPILIYLTTIVPKKEEENLKESLLSKPKSISEVKENDDDQDLLNKDLFQKHPRSSSFSQ